jgi:hypothetical protein
MVLQQSCVYYNRITLRAQYRLCLLQGAGLFRTRPQKWCITVFWYRVWPMFLSYGRIAVVGCPNHDIGGKQMTADTFLQALSLVKMY